MGKYVDATFVTAVYSSLSSVASTSVGSYHIPMAEAKLESMLGRTYSIPFSDNNLTVKELVTELVYIKIGNLAIEQRKERMEMFNQRIDDLISGKEALVTTSGDLIQSSGEPVWSETEDYHPVFGMLDHEDSIVDSSQVEAELDERGIYR